MMIMMNNEMTMMITITDNHVDYLFTANSERNMTRHIHNYLTKYDMQVYG